MKTAEMTIGQDYAYDRHASASWTSGGMKATLLATKVDAKAYSRSQRGSLWATSDPKVRERIIAENAERHAEFLARYGLPDLPVEVADDMSSTVAVQVMRYNSKSNAPEPVIRLVNARYIVEPWADCEQRKREKHEAIERRRLADAAAEAARKAKREQWASEYPAVGEALASIGLTVPQGVDGIFLNPEQAKMLAEFIRSNTTTLRAA